MKTFFEKLGVVLLVFLTSAVTFLIFWWTGQFLYWVVAGQSSLDDTFTSPQRLEEKNMMKAAFDACIKQNGVPILDSFGRMGACQFPNTPTIQKDTTAKDIGDAITNTAVIGGAAYVAGQLLK